MTIELTHGQVVQPQSGCSWCGCRPAAYLGRLNPRPDEAARHISSCVFQCVQCHATRVIQLRDAPA